MNCQVIPLFDDRWSDILNKLRHDIYHLPGYLTLEAERIGAIAEALVIQDSDSIFFVPYLVRHCEDILPHYPNSKPILDVISPYGYPSILLNEAALRNPEFGDAALEALKEDFRSRGICSAFFRLHPILSESYISLFKADTFQANGETVSVDLRLENLWSPTKSGHRSTINKCKRLGMTAKMGPLMDGLEEFVEIYAETMDRVSASRSYYAFDTNYFQRMNSLMGDRLHVCRVDYEGQVACVGLYTECCGIVQSTLGGTKNQFVHLSPSSLETDYARYWAKERGHEFLHLGGGVGGSKHDSVYAFKAGFSKLRHPFFTLRMIIDETNYQTLVYHRAKALNCSEEKLLQTNFFPAYRAS